MNFIIAQVLGGIALILVCISYFLKKKSNFMILQTIANFFYSSAFFVVEAYVGFALVMVSLFRCIYLYYAEKNSFKYTLHFIPLFITLYITFTVILWNNPYDFMPLISSTIFTLGFTTNNALHFNYS